MSRANTFHHREWNYQDIVSMTILPGTPNSPEWYHDKAYSSRWHWCKASRKWYSSKRQYKAHNWVHRVSKRIHQGHDRTDYWGKMCRRLCEGDIFSMAQCTDCRRAPLCRSSTRWHCRACILCNGNRFLAWGSRRLPVDLSLSHTYNFKVGRIIY